MNSFWWLWGALCLPLTVPVMVYQVIGTMRNKKRKAALHGKIVVITGASSGVGEALAHTFYSHGCKVVLAARRVDELNRVKQDLLQIHSTVPTYPPIVLSLDLSEINDLDKCVQKVYDIYGCIDILINNGGVGHRGDILTTKMDVDIKIMAVNYFGPVALTKAVLPKMIEQKAGHVVFVSSLQGKISIPGRSAYGASKHAMQAFADSLRAEVHEHNIEVSIISPGYIKTALSINALTGTGTKHGLMDKTTAAGYSPDYVAEKILGMVTRKQKELILCPFTHRLAVFLRYLLPGVFFWIMANRAKKLS